MQYTIEEINELSFEDFTQIFINIVEHSGLIGASIWALRPFSNLNHLHAEFSNFINQLPPLGREGILRSHPDLAGRIASEGKLTSESTKEQKAAELNLLSPQEKITLTTLNDKYKTKFGFPFVICARENKKDAILKGIKTRVENPKEIELETGIEEVKKIAYYRLLDIVKA